MASRAVSAARAAEDRSRCVALPSGIRGSAITSHTKQNPRCTWFDERQVGHTARGVAGSEGRASVDGRTFSGVRQAAQTASAGSFHMVQPRHAHDPSCFRSRPTPQASPGRCHRPQIAHEPNIRFSALTGATGGSKSNGTRSGGVSLGRLAAGSVVRDDSEGVIASSELVSNRSECYGS